MSYDVIDYGDGQQCGTGLIVQDVRPTGVFPSVLMAPGFRMLTKAEVEKITTDPRRTPGRKQFGPDWIRNQGGRGSCNGYAGAKALERARVLRGQPRVVLSGEGLYAQINDGRDVGSMLDRGMKCLMEHGVPPEDMVRREEYLWRNISEQAKQARARFKAHEAFELDKDEDAEDQLASGLAAGFMAVVAVHFTGAMQRLDAHGVAGGVEGPGNHAVGNDDVRVRGGRYEFDFFNSHGLQYGDQGRAWLTWDRHYATTIKYHAFYLIPSTNDDPQGV